MVSMTNRSLIVVIPMSDPGRGEVATAYHQK